MKKFSPGYKRNTHPFKLRLLSIWRILTCKNYILIDFTEHGSGETASRKVRPLYRTNYNAESEMLTLTAAYHMKEKETKSKTNETI